MPNDRELGRAATAAHERFFQARRSHPDFPSRAWYLRLYQAGLREWGVADADGALAARLHDLTASLPPTLVVEESVPALLEALRGRGLRLAVISNYTGTLLDDFKALGLTGYFDAILDSQMLGIYKPDPEIFRVACAATGCKPEEALHVGDSPAADVAGALAAGVKPILLDPLDAFAGGLGEFSAVPRIRRLVEVPALLRTM
ncbi:MAG: HAD-IA family hydrolase [Firmicutes bacterium]|nr:HAD-IA family hydrolase [Bacillota bacterium]